MKALKFGSSVHSITQRIVICACCVFLFLRCFNALAHSIRVVDQFGNPIENVVISFNEDKTSTFDTNAMAIMDQVNMQFLPKVLVIQKNQSVAFPNSDNTRHHIYSFSKPKPFEIKMFKGGDSKKLTFEQSGIVVLGCNIHDKMIGYIYVAENKNTAITNAQGIAEVPAMGLSLKLWHPKLSTNKIARKDIQLPATYGENPFPIVLTLIEDVATPIQHTFKSKKFKRGNE
jgi:plastocyanin